MNIPAAVCVWIVLFLGAAQCELPPEIHRLVEPALKDLLSDPPVHDEGRRRRDPVACSDGSQPLELTDYSGWFTSPDYPAANYPNNANCQWLIRSQEPNGVVELDFSFLIIEEYYDGIEIFDGPSIMAPRIAAFDGRWTSLPTGIRSSGSSVLLRFFSDESVRGQGFNVSYTSDVLRTMSDPCYPLSRPYFLTQASGTFSSNNYPSSYWSYAECAWLVEAQTIGGVVQISFTYFSTQGSGDVLYLHDGPNANAQVLATITGQYGLSTSDLRYTTTQGYLFARFVTDRSGVDRGFNANYASV